MATMDAQTDSAVPAAESVIRARQLSKKYGSQEALASIDLDIKRGEIFGLIGPDGAGKTTTFHILGGVMEPTSGEVTVLDKRPRDARLNIGYLTQQFSLSLDLSIDENLRYMAGIRRVAKEDFERLRKKYLRLMGIERFGNRLAGQLSGGMKQKLALCCALITRPQVLLLDEPTTGVDPVSRREFWDVLASIASEGMTIAVATPYLDEAERCHRVALIHEGVIKQVGTPLQLRQNLKLERLELRTKNLEALENALDQLRGKEQSAIVDVQEFGDRLDVLVPDAEKGEKALRSVAEQIGEKDIEIEKEEPTLENVFVLSLQQAGSDDASKSPFNFTSANEHRNDTVAIGADKINKTFGDFQAVKDVDLDIRYGEIYGLLGANGAGKTTTIKMLCGLLKPTSGTMVLAGQSKDLRSAEIRQRIGYMSQKFTLYDDLTIQENLEFYCGVYAVPMEFRKERINWALASCGLLSNANLITGKLPGGWKQRLAFGASVMHEPEILFLDEPTSGVDPIARRQLWRMISEFARHGTAILVTTHFLEEAEHCHRLGFMVAGELTVQGTPSELKESQPGQLIELTTSNTQTASDLLKQHLASWRVSIFADRLHLVLDHPDAELPPLIDLMSKSGIQVHGHKVGRFSLEDAFIGVVQRAEETGR